MSVEAGKYYFSTKSGNEVKAIKRVADYRGQEMWEVERTSGASIGKRLHVSARALVVDLELVGA